MPPGSHRANVNFSDLSSFNLFNAIKIGRNLCSRSGAQVFTSHLADCPQRNDSASMRWHCAYIQREEVAAHHQKQYKSLYCFSFSALEITAPRTRNTGHKSWPCLNTTFLWQPLDSPSPPPAEPALSPPGASSVCRWRRPGFPEREPPAPSPRAPSCLLCGTHTWPCRAADKPEDATISALMDKPGRLE